MYPFKECPYCGEEVIHSTGDTITCKKCGSHSLITALAKIYHLTEPMIMTALKEDQINNVEYRDDMKNSLSGTFCINGVHDGRLINNFPSLFPCYSAAEGGTPILLAHGEEYIDIIPTFPGPSDTFVYFGEWVPRWNKIFEGKKVVIVIGNNEVESRSVARQLTNHKALVTIGYWQGDIAQTIEDAQPFILNPIQDSLTIADKKGTDLRTIIDSYHRVSGGGRYDYKASINVPVRLIVADVIQWFQDNGATFIWDTDSEQGYMLFNKNLYSLRAHDASLKSLLWTTGGVTSANAEGRAIIEGLCAMGEESIRLKPEPWIKADIVANKIELRQGGKSIVMEPNSLRIDDEVKLSYDLIRNQKRWFQPLTLTEEPGLPYLFKEIANFFAVDPIAREIIMAWLIGIFLKDYATIRPGMRISGPPSAGKSTVLQLLNWLFYGQEDGNLTSEPTIAGLWRLASVEPFIPLDNKNVRELDDSLRTFLDVCCYAGKRPIGVSGTTNEFREQKTDSFVMISGLDSFLHHDVRTRYIEITSSPEYKTRFYPPRRKAIIFKQRDAIFSDIFRMLAYDVLPFLDEYVNEDMCDKYRILLDSKERIVDYFLIMLAVGDALKKRGIIPKGDVGARWTDYIREQSSKADVKNSVTIEWWKNMKIALVRENIINPLNIEGASLQEDYKFIRKEGRVIGMMGSQEELLNAMAWAANALRRKLPWKDVSQFKVAHKVDSKAWDAMGWKFYKEGEIYNVEWGEGI